MPHGIIRAAVLFGLISRVSCGECLDAFESGPWAAVDVPLYPRGLSKVARPQHAEVQNEGLICAFPVLLSAGSYRMASRRGHSISTMSIISTSASRKWFCRGAAATGAMLTGCEAYSTDCTKVGACGSGKPPFSRFIDVLNLQF